MTTFIQRLPTPELFRLYAQAFSEVGSMARVLMEEIAYEYEGGAINYDAVNAAINRGLRRRHMASLIGLEIQKRLETAPHRGARYLTPEEFWLAGRNTARGFHEYRRLYDAWDAAAGWSVHAEHVCNSLNARVSWFMDETKMGVALGAAFEAIHAFRQRDAGEPDRTEAAVAAFEAACKDTAYQW